MCWVVQRLLSREKLWAVFKQTSQFTLAMMTDTSNRMSEWETAVTMIKCKSDFKLLDVLLIISGAEVTNATKLYRKRKQPELNKEDDKHNDNKRSAGRSDAKNNAMM